MKFARYLEETQIPEWKKAYIDYRGLKKRITAIRKSQQTGEFVEDSPPASPRPDQLISGAENPSVVHSLDITEQKPALDHPSSPALRASSHRDSALEFADKEEAGNVGDEIKISQTQSRQSRQSAGHPRSSFRGRRPSTQGLSISTIRRGLSTSRANGPRNRPINPLAALPLHDLISQLSSKEASFFTLLDSQLEKVESFYLAREKEMLARGKMLQEQLSELHDHRKLVLAAHPKTAWTSALKPPSLFPFRRKSKEVISNGTENGEEENDEGSHSNATHKKKRTWKFTRMGKDDDSSSDSGRDGSGRRGIPLSTDRESYLNAKKKLKKAVSEHYRGLESLHNYRILNITGFRKALKKFEKVTKIPAQHQYMTEKVEKSAFASDKPVREMMTEMENMYADAFVRGDKRRTLHRLRGGFHFKSHHFSTFRSGLFLGIALPPLIAGIVYSYQERTRREIPGWDGLLFVYGILFIPVLFVTLVGINLLVWSRSRINYVFIFELDIRTRLDYREYFEIPCILMAGLCYAFWLSFAQIGAPSISPTIWPLVWLGFAALIVLDPFSLLYKSSRYWLVKNVSKLLLSGTRRVEFADFWMGDQFCSLIFTLSNLYLFACVYSNGIDENWRKCAVSSPRWPVAYCLGVLPLFIRLVQSIKRYVDSGLITHLINGGKYGSGIISNLFYFLWRHHGMKRGSIFILWCVFNVNYSLYASLWDFLMDWSVLRLHAKYPLLRSEVVYSDHIPLYYFAIISNFIVRFIWIMYIPTGGPNIQFRTFIAGILEVLRRWQWNFYRLENEHLGNMDQYRITREVPLPYSFDQDLHEDDGEDDSEIESTSARSKK